MSEGCKSCSGRCCCDIYVRVTGFDVQRIAQAQQVAIRSFCEMPLERDESGAGFLLADGRRHDLVLAQQTDQDRSCIWLMHLDEHLKRCGTYASRPRVCAVYPFEISRGTIDVRENARCKPEDWQLASLDLKARRYEFAMYIAEFELFAAMVGAWNDDPVPERTESAFQGFVLDAVGRFLTDYDSQAEVVRRWSEALLPDHHATEKHRLLTLARDTAHEVLAGRQR